MRARAGTISCARRLGRPGYKSGSQTRSAAIRDPLLLHPGGWPVHVSPVFRFRRPRRAATDRRSRLPARASSIWASSRTSDRRARVSFDIELTTPACPIKAEFEQAARERVVRSTGVERVRVTMTSTTRGQNGPPAGAPDVLPGVKNVIAVAPARGAWARARSP